MKKKERESEKEKERVKKSDIQADGHYERINGNLYVMQRESKR